MANCFMHNSRAGSIEEGSHLLPKTLVVSQVPKTEYAISAATNLGDMFHSTPACSC
jgi:hypothetical protein